MKFLNPRTFVGGSCSGWVENGNSEDLERKYLQSPNQESLRISHISRPAQEGGIA